MNNDNVIVKHQHGTSICIDVPCRV